MRGADITQEALFSTAHLDKFVPHNHPHQTIRQLFNTAMERINRLFDTANSEWGRKSIPPERLLRAQLLQLLYSIRSERQGREQMHYRFESKAC